MKLPPNSRDKILPLTSLRFFLALTLMLGHGFRNAPALTHSSGWMANLGDHVFILCPFFFFLSGFVLAWSYFGAGSQRATTPFDIKKFWLTRFARLYPLYVAALLLDFPHYLHVRTALPSQAAGGLHQVLMNAVVNLMTLQAWFPIYNTIVGPSWAVGIEVFFYLLFPWIGAWLWRLPARAAWVFALLAYPAGLALVALAVRANVDIFVLKYNPGLHLFEFLLGILLARAYVSLMAKPALTQKFDRLAAPLGALSILAVAAVMAVPSQLQETPYLLLQHGLLMPLFALIILAFASHSRAIAALFSLPFFVLLGEASYGIFLLHFPINFIFRHAILRYDVPMFVLVCLLIIGLSVLSVYFLETPLRRIILTRRASQ